MLNYRQGTTAIKSGTNETRTGTFVSKTCEEVGVGLHSCSITLRSKDHNGVEGPSAWRQYEACTWRIPTEDLAVRLPTHAARM